MALFITRISFVLLLVNICNCDSRAFIAPLGSHETCTSSICRFTLTIREEMSMTKKFTPGKIFREGETLLLQLKDGKLIQERGTFYQQPTFKDMDDLEVKNVTEDVITADGFTRPVITINGKFPGPTLQVTEGAEVEVIVKNQMIHKSITIHWHGFHMHETPWMDGVAYITQCPISPMTSFMYRFKAFPSGTLWYHSHLGGLRADGAFGFFIVHKELPKIPFFPLLINHWLHIPFNEFMITNPYKKKNEGQLAGAGQFTYSFHHLHMTKPRAWKSIDGVRLSSMMFNSALINGRGRFKNNKAPISWFKVTKDSWNGFYIVNPGVEYTFAISIDEHEMQIIGLDIADVQPETVHTIYLNPGERVKVKLLADRPVSNYWIRGRTLDYHGEVMAVLHYEGANEKEPTSNPIQCNDDRPCFVYNCPSANLTCKFESCKTAYQMKAIGRSYSFSEKVQSVDKEIFLDFAFPIGASVNGYRFVLPKNHLYTDIPLDTKCTAKNCKGKACYCTQYIDLPYNKTIQMVLTNLGDPDKVHGHHHTIHLHGHDFAVLKTGYPKAHPATGEMLAPNDDIYCIDRLCRMVKWANYRQVSKSFNLHNPPMQDSVLLPYGGYAVVRIRTENPGNWLMHCHQMMHAIEGMDVVIRVESGRVPPPPIHFQKYCGGFTFTHEEFQQYRKDKVN